MTNRLVEIDYANSGLSIQTARLEVAKAFGKKSQKPLGINWGGKIILGADRFACGNHGRVRLSFLHSDPNVEQAVDLKSVPGFELEGGERVSLLRTWFDSRYEDTVEYPYTSSNGVLSTWNVFRYRFPSGEIRDERWIGNAGFWVEEHSPTDRVYHCSHGMADPPDFDALQYRVSVFPR